MSLNVVLQEGETRIQRVPFAEQIQIECAPRSRLIFIYFKKAAQGSKHVQVNETRRSGAWKTEQ